MKGLTLTLSALTLQAGSLDEVQGTESVWLLGAGRLLVLIVVCLPRTLSFLPSPAKSPGFTAMN